MSQTIVAQVLTYYTDKTTSMAVKIAKQADQIATLKRALAESAKLAERAAG
jgi:hypothetical protein